MKNTQANRSKFLKGYLKILLSWKDKKQDHNKMFKALEELNQSFPSKRAIKLYKGISNLGSDFGSDFGSNLGSNLWSNLWSNLGSDFGSNLGSNLWSNLGSDFRSDFRSNLGSNLGSNLWSNLGSNFGSDFGSNLGSNLWSDFRSNLGSDFGSETWEYYEFIWPVFIEHFYKNLPTIKKRIKTIRALDKCIKSGVGYLWLSSTTLYALPFPKISIDNEKRLHAEAKPACIWSDKEKSWWIHGVKVNQKIVETPEMLTKKDWLDEKNLEIRRVIQDRMPDFAKKLGAKRIQKDSYGELLEIDLKDDPEKVARYVKVKDASTPREYYLRCPPTMKTAKEAIAWSFGLTEGEYKPEVET
jgi:hypothetical protein